MTGTDTTTVRSLRPLGSRYIEVRARICELVEGLGDPSSVAVPACPRWSVHDLICHLTGNCADVMSGNLEGLASESWTAAQVAERKGRSTAAVLEEWAELAPSYASMIDDFPGRLSSMAVADITVHEHDLRDAVGRPGARDTEDVHLATDFVLTGIVHAGMEARGLGPLEVRAGSKRWLVGTGTAPHGDTCGWQEALLEAETPVVTAPPLGCVTAEPFELFRAITGRRSARQIRSFGWTVDPEPYLPAFGSDPFSLRADDLDE